MAAQQKLINSERKDRSIRLWGERGQLALETGHICVLSATALATEVLKNLVLPGVGAFTIVDRSRVTERDLGNNFFVTEESIGQPRGSEVMRNLLELNSEVQGHFLDENPVDLIETNPSSLLKFSCVVVTDLPDAPLAKLAALLWAHKVPLMIGRAYGMIGTWRNVFPQVCIIESRPEYAKENYRLAAPFPELQAFADLYDPATCKHPYLPTTESNTEPGVWIDNRGLPCVPKAHSHIPAFVLLIKALEQWRKDHAGAVPTTSAEKDAFRDMLDDQQVSLVQDEENWVEAKQQARHAYAPFEIPSEVKGLFQDENASAAGGRDPDVEPFWIVVAALKRFVDCEGKGSLPLSGALPDMHSDTKSFIQLQDIYKHQAAKEYAQVSAHVQGVLAEAGLPNTTVRPEEVALACKNAANLRAVRTRSLEAEYKSPVTEDWGWMLDMPEEFPHHLYVLLRAADRYRASFGAFPGESASPSYDGDLVRFKEAVVGLCGDMGISPSSIGEDMQAEMVRYGGAELHTVAAVLGGVGAQEISKVLMKQFTPGNGTFVLNAVTGKNAMCIF
eukprot:CAMPEP_0180130334 /NCGR_PEP_ID=MMETSP0986-20121125/7813_1 /TAXON_ID=697907 /ORGANISM="non described non described, Strain CCMP2293" /LENGTH=559 /DNA_ID=CAMNT_0022070101 /DNA_START=40 /DNA_END=1719 /DNA_ORIENTATION=+